MSIEYQLISEIKTIIERDNLYELQEKWQEYIYQTDFGREIAWDYVFQKIYLHAALKKKKNICNWLDSIFKYLDPIQQIALKQMFPYARSLLMRK